MTFRDLSMITLVAIVSGCARVHVGRAARGGLAGLAIGAIASDAARGAAIGAVAGGAVGRRRAPLSQQAAQEAFERAVAAFRDSFRLSDRHWTACMIGNEYGVG